MLMAILGLIFNAMPVGFAGMATFGLAFFYPQLYLLAMIILWSAASMPLLGDVRGLLSIARWGLLAIAALVSIASSFKDSFSVLLVKLKPIQVLMLIMVTVVLVLGAYSVNTGLSYLKGTIFLTLVVFFMFGYRHFIGDASRRVPSMLNRIGWLLIAVGILSIAYFVVAPSGAVLGAAFGGIYRQPNSLGAIIGVFAIPLFVYKFTCMSGSWKKVFHGGVLLINIGILLATRSRAGMLAGLVGAFTILFFLRRRAVVILLLWFGIVVLIVGQYFSFWSDINQELVFKGREEFLTGRGSMWEEGIENIMEKPLWGWGFGASKASMDWEFSTSTGEGDREKGSSYLGIIEELGFLGAIPAYVLIFYLISQLRFIIRMRRRILREEWVLLLVLYSIIVAGLVDAGFEAWLFSLGSHIAIFYWLVVFLYFGLRDRVEGSLNPSPTIPKIEPKLSVLIS